jgi:cohesin loading factor subunit SCC2
VGKVEWQRWTPAVLSRVLKILDRSVRAGEDLDPFHYVAGIKMHLLANPKSKRSARKRKTATERTRMRPRRCMAVDEPPPPPPPPQEATEADLEHLTKILEIAKDSVLAADCCIALLGSDRLTKQV